jgi:hypothetical protein
MATEKKQGTHTPGPWQAKWVNHESFSVRIETIAQKDGSTFAICEVPKFARRREEQSANASLIAAAPDLLAACETIVSILRANPQTSAIELLDSVESCEDAITRARGGSQ